MSFQGLASALVVLVIIGIVLGILLKAEFERMREPGTRAIESPTATSRGSLSAAPGANGGTTAVPQMRSDRVGPRRKEPERWERDLEQRQEALRLAQIDFEAWTREMEAELAAERQSIGQAKADVERSRERLKKAQADFAAWKREQEANLAVERQRLEELADVLDARGEAVEQAQAGFAAWKKEREANLKTAREKMRSETETVSQLWNWSVLALCGAGALTIGNTAVTVARRSAWQRRSRRSVETHRTQLRRAYLRPNKQWTVTRSPRHQSRGEQGASQTDAHGVSPLWTQRKRRHRAVLKGGERPGQAIVAPLPERTGGERIAPASEVVTYTAAANS